jgi:hypothetical protein
MQSENFDNKIRESLSQRPPGNDNPQWDKMEAMLEKHLPQEKKDRRRIIFILFTFLLLGGGVFFVWQNRSGNKNNISAIESNKKTRTEVNEPLEKNTNNASVNNNNTQEVTTIDQKQKDANNEVSFKKEAQTKILDVKNTIAQTSPNAEFTLRESSVKKTKNNKSNDRILNDKKNNSNKIVDNKQPETISNPIEDVAAKASDPVVADKQAETKESEQQKSPIENKITEQKQEPRESQPKTVKPSTTNKKKDKRSFFDNLFFSVSGGADLSTVGISDAGTVKPVYGAGIGYRISNRFSIRTGFYSARKVYDADPKDYHPPSNFWNYYPNLKNIEANCKVYEIPVAIDYTLNKSKKQTWFASAGVSSLIMKEEVYDYYYKPNTSPTYVTYTRKFENQNKHYFSVLDLSAGYRRNINKNFSLQAEPYMKIAMGGVGFGKVKLNSGGVLVSAIVKPFAKK